MIFRLLFVTTIFSACVKPPELPKQQNSKQVLKNQANGPGFDNSAITGDWDGNSFRSYGSKFDIIPTE